MEDFSYHFGSICGDWWDNLADCGLARRIVNTLGNAFWVIESAGILIRLERWLTFLRNS